jgi:dTDP-L-rhamnose 4-epimerase
MKIAITGGLGFIGQHLCRGLLAKGHDLLLIDSLTPQIHGDLPAIQPPKGATVVRMDICQIAERYEVIDGVDIIFHLAAETGTGQSMYQMSHYTHVNCKGTTALLEAVAKCTKRPKQIVLGSSRSVYGEGAYTPADDPGPIVAAATRTREALEDGCWDPVDENGRSIKPVPTSENFPFAPGSIYAATKAAQELLLVSASIALGVRTTILRFQNVYGEGQSLRNPYTGIISIFFNRARQGLHIPVYEDGLESRDFIHVNDVVAALAGSIETSLPNGIIMNVGSGVPTSVSLLADTLLKASGFDVPIQVTGQYRLGDIRHCFADLNQVTKHIGFVPKISLENGLKRFCVWAITNPINEDRSEKAEAELKERGLAN